ncbi:MAG: L-threonylcarbamoyladenylate synthase [Actinomycetota bacterium]|nr:L-threonylcarbamoyladenylate synthase [Actinomycetota bacterium]MDQ2956638.1 L-threonylcarbamoyladenylate synthase [Actinomycetota bacterium]
MAIATAARAVKAGSVVVLPTDTLYGIGADAFNPSAVASVLAAKGRGRDLPVPVLVGSWSTIDGLVSWVPAVMRDLIEAFWPGGLTLVVEHAPSLAWDLGDARGTVAIRMPLHPIALDLLGQTGPMAVSSANISSQPAAVTAQQAYEQLGESVSVYLDGGEVPLGQPSTIVDLTADIPVVLREGAVSLAALREVVATIEGRPVG